MARIPPTYEDNLILADRLRKIIGAVSGPEAVATINRACGDYIENSPEPPWPHGRGLGGPPISSN